VDERWLSPCLLESLLQTPEDSLCGAQIICIDLALRQSSPAQGVEGFETYASDDDICVRCESRKEGSVGIGPYFRLDAHLSELCGLLWCSDEDCHTERL